MSSLSILIHRLEEASAGEAKATRQLAHIDLTMDDLRSLHSVSEYGEPALGVPQSVVKSLARRGLIGIDRARRRLTLTGKGKRLEKLGSTLVKDAGAQMVVAPASQGRSMERPER